VAGALGGIATTLLAAGCDTGDDLTTPGTTAAPSGSTTPTATAPTTPEQTPDEALVDEAGAALGSALGVLASARRIPPLRAPLAPLVRAHREHLAVLESSGDGSASAPVMADPAAALRGVNRSERALHATLADAAGRAESGALAKLLASMSASVTQHLAVLPERV
jgi:hypothetical protein